ncbi:MAG: ketoacyl-ACP synthase III [Rickettsiales bacterium]|jgi:3-oxoacyl-[acyl-carrier-protein] synthase-3|nr:ketoacyl-ACP synthase III [Rickettsiales bacterium]
MGNRLVGYGTYLPEKIMTNADFAKVMDTSDEWIVSRTGMKERHWARADESVADMAATAARRALENAKLKIDDIDMIIAANCTAELDFPSVAVQVSGMLGAAANIPAFDVKGACTGAIFAMHSARAFFSAGMHKRILIIGAEKMSRLVDMTDRNTAVLFGDGAAAMIFEASSSNFSGIVDSVVFSDGKDFGILHGTADHKISMNGPETYKRAVQYMPDAARFIMDHAGIAADDIDWIVPHQANIRIIQSGAERLGFPIDKVITTVDLHGNTSAASGMLAMAWAMDNGKIKRGDLIMYPAFGSGLTWGSVLIRI